MRTNVVLDDELMREARQYSDAPTKRALLEDALRTLIETRSAAKRRLSYADQVRQLDQQLAGMVVRERPSDLLRQDRNRR